ncbi:MAG: GrpB family protein [Gemmatimonadetes bacterium]|nr:GrpB family protein [Gemmatimonadota bacterium]
MHPSLGLESGTVRVVPYDATWAALFAAEAARITEALTPLPVRLEHTGSTSVPGLAAKPIIDILAGRLAGEPVAPYVEALVRAGYDHRGEQGIPGREFFRRGTPRSYHVHMVEVESAFWRDHLRFRDLLRADASVAAAYGKLKEELAERFPRDREAYTEGKGPFVLEVLRRT